MTFTREDYEMAAKAVGIALVWSSVEGLSPRIKYSLVLWDPPNDDCDALRLAVALGLVIDCSRPSAGMPYELHHYGQEGFTDQNAATRRAIFRAAIAVGRAMP
jgi:hypothetical protein